MTDVLDELRRVDPVDAGPLDVPPRLAARVLDAPAAPRGRRRWWLPAAGAAAAACAGVAVVIVVDEGSPPDLAQRAYAATGGPGVIHWRTEIANFQDGRLTMRQRTEGWSSRGVVHVLRYDLPRGGARLMSDERIAGGRSRAWIAVANDYLTGPAPKPANDAAVILLDRDPMVQFRQAYRAGRLVAAGPGRYRFSPRSGAGIGLSFTYELDRRTALPRRLIARAVVPAAPGRRAHRDATVFTFSVYEKLPSTDATRAKLQLLAHPGAGPSNVPAARYFEALRTGNAPKGESRRRLASMASHMTRFHIDAAGIRQARPGVWLLPGRGYVCIAVANGGGLGGSCSTVAQAAARGISVGTSPGGITLVVPDGVRTVLARLPHRRWRPFPVDRGTVHLPSLGYHWRFEH